MPKGVYSRKPVKRSSSRKDAWSKSEIDFVRNNYKNMTQQQLSEKLGRTVCSVNTIITKHKLKKKKTPRPWSDEDIDFLKNNHLTMSRKELAKALNRHKGTIGGKLCSLGLKLPEEQLKKIRNKFLEKGHGWNKGLKGTHFSPATEFKKGHKPVNTKYDGCIVIRTDHETRGGFEEKWIRVSEGHWRQLKFIIWEKKYGKVPPGKILAFKKGADHLDVKIENLD